MAKHAHTTADYMHRARGNRAVRKTNDSGSPLAAAAPCARKYLRALCTHACTADVCTALALLMFALLLHCACTALAQRRPHLTKRPVLQAPRQASRQFSSWAANPRKINRIKGEEEEGGRERGLKAWPVIKRRFRGRYEMGGSA